MSQEQLLHRVEAGTLRTAHHLGDRLVGLPDQVAERVDRSMQQKHLAVMQQVHNSVDYCVRAVYKRIHLDAADAISRGTGRHGPLSPARSSSSLFSSDEPCAARTEPPAAADNTPPPAAAADLQPPTEVWVPPRPTMVEQPATRKRARSAPPNSMPSALRADGWYIGNDLQTVSQVWDLRTRIQQWIGENPNRANSWHTKSHESQTERTAQERLRTRRKSLWDAIIAASQTTSTSTIDIVKQLQDKQTEMSLGISRIEIWALTAKKRGTTVLDEAEAYSLRTSPRKSSGITADPADGDPADGDLT